MVSDRRESGPEIDERPSNVAPPAESPLASPTHAAPAPPELEDCGDQLRANPLTAIEFQRRILQALVEEPGITLESARPFTARLRREERAYTIRLDGAFRRYRHGEVEPEQAAEEIKAALGVPGIDIQREGPFPRLERRENLPPGVFALDCDFDPALVVSFVWALPYGLVPLEEHDVAREWPDLSALWKQALEQLGRRTETAPASGSGEGSTLLLRWSHGDGLDAAAMLLPDLRAEAAGWVEGSLLMAAPARDMLVAIGDADPDHVARIADEVREAYERLPEPISPRLYAVG